MNVRKRGLALLMCICMIFTLLPFSALADNGTGETLAVEPSSEPPSMLTVSSVKIVDNIANEGCLTLEALDADNKDLSAAELKAAGYNITWTRDNVPVKRIKASGDNYNMAEDSSSVNVAYDKGAQKTYKVTVSKDGSAPLSASQKVDWYDALQNPSFEEPDILSPSSPRLYGQWFAEGIVQTAQDSIPHWKTTASDGNIEIGNVTKYGYFDKNGNYGGENWSIDYPYRKQVTQKYYNCDTAVDGNQIAELNCTGEGALYQDVLTTPGETMNWNLHHRGRNGTDMMALVIAPFDGANGAKDVTTQAQLTNYIDSHKNDTDTGVLVKYLTDGQTWGYKNGEYKIPEGQYLTRFFFVAISTYDGNGSLTEGNLLDNAWFSTEPVPPTADQGTLTITKTIVGLSEDQAKPLIFKEGLITYKIGEGAAQNASFVSYTVNDNGSITATCTINVDIPKSGSASVTVAEDKEKAALINYDLAVSNAGADDITDNPEQTVTIGKQGTICVAFTNTYTEQKGTIEINKTVTGDLPLDKLPDSFTFEISGESLQAPITVTANKQTDNTYSAATATLPYGEYTVRENDAAVDGYKLTTTGLDNVSISKENKNVKVNVTNTYTAPEAATVTLTAKKYLDGELAKTKFKFVLKDKDERIIQTKYNNENGIVTFDKLSFAEAGNHIYYISEVAGDKTSINYDKTVYKVTVHVTLDTATGNYVSSVAYSKLLDDGAPAPTTNNEAVFNNTTKPTGSLTISKTVSGNAASTTKEFTFKVMLLQNANMLKGEYTYGNVTFTDGVATFNLKHNESVTITGIPAGLNYAVTESDNNGYTVTVNGQNTTMATGTIAAGETSTAAFKNTKNYVYPPNPPIMDEITVEITGNSDSVVYDGTEHSVKDYTVKISDPRYTEADFTFTGKAEASGVNAGTYEMGLKAEQFKNTNARFTNVKFVIKADGVLTITPKELTITAGSKTEYGPTPVTCDEWTVSGLAAGDKVESVKITGIQSVPGSSPNVPSDAVIKNAKGEDVTKNYAIKYVNGTLTMLEVLNKEDHFNYIIGTPEGLSLPTANVTRAEVATIFFRLMTDDARAKFDSLDNNFSDVAKGKWYNRAISTLANAGIIKGDPAGTYRPGDPITRAEMAAIIARFGDFKEGGKTFNDISGHWAQKYIELAASNGWINGNPDGTFKPNNNITRAETVAMINRVLDRQTKDVSDLLPVAQMTNWSDNMDTAKWYYRDMQEATNNHKAERVGNSIYEKWTEKLPDIDWASYQI